MNTFQENINLIPASLFASGLRHAVICPGSRNAPLIMAFSRHSGIQCHSVTDERTAGFVALGLAKSSKTPVVVICTSGSALANIYPSVLEAYYMQIPLLVLSADRPPQMIDRWDGQTIRQNGIFGSHVISNHLIPSSNTEVLLDEISQLCRIAYLHSIEHVHGPVHINVPMDEPLYEAVKDDFDYHVFNYDEKLVSENKPFPMDLNLFKSYSKIMLLIGADVDFEKYDSSALKNKGVLVLCDVCSNTRNFSQVQNWESVLLSMSELEWEQNKPQLLITCGKMVLNKNIKHFLRSNPPERHLHIDSNGFFADTYFTQAIIWQSNLSYAFKLIEHQLTLSENYVKEWILLSKFKTNLKSKITDLEFSEIWVLNQILKQIDSNSVIHLANSMSVRYAAFLADDIDESIKIYSNRGVSGIDGCTSTAIGMSMENDKQNVLITGDIAFLYDINAFLQQKLVQNLKIIVLNNGGGGIFSQIKGPKEMREFDPFLLTPQAYNLSKLSEVYELNYEQVNNKSELEEKLNNFLTSNSLSILDIKTDITINQKAFKQFKNNYI